MKTTTILTNWYAQHKRALPWRENPEPYRVWLSEIILQQTRVAQGTAYFERFVEAFPTVSKLADAPQDAVLKLWEGLGYYSRARNLHTAAKQIVAEFDGIFPEKYHQLLTLKGVGPYTAAAIASICFGQKTAVVDGNVFRVLARLHGIEAPINSTAGLKLFQDLANKLIAESVDPGEHNQAIMEFGALQCVPKNPICAACPFAKKCVAYNTGAVARLPVKQKAKPVRHRFLHFFVVEKEGCYFFNQRDSSDIWGRLFQLPVLETSTAVTNPRALAAILGDFSLKPTQIDTPIVHLLSHQKLHISFWRMHKLPEGQAKNNVLYPRAKIAALALPIVLKRFVDANLLHLPPHKN